VTCEPVVVDDGRGSRGGHPLRLHHAHDPERGQHGGGGGESARGGGGGGGGASERLNGRRKYDRPPWRLGRIPRHLCCAPVQVAR